MKNQQREKSTCHQNQHIIKIQQRAKNELLMRHQKNTRRSKSSKHEIHEPSTIEQRAFNNYMKQT